MTKMIPLAIVYDFDGTLAPGNMQERDFIPAIGMTTSQFWEQVSAESKKHQADNILVYMKLMLDKANSEKVQVREKDFKNYGKNLSLFDGVLPYHTNDQSEKGWFDRINIYGKESGIKIEHFIVSSGVREMIQGTPIGKKFSAIYASSFFYDHHGIAKWPALAINYTTKTQYLFRINKGCLDVSDNTEINRYVPDSERKVPFSNMIYIGDGETDIPCFRLVNDRGGYSVAVYKPKKKGARNKLCKLAEGGRIDFLAPADYCNNSKLDKIIKSIIDKVQTDNYLNEFRGRE
ncbi:MAG TPA: HAD family hydrolase [Bacteroidales bacterium]|nr:HAD family hydrolase [Bacteroidales bacterium]HSA42669.1 HAD family hydrolase [Bacteroidales bacterium]